MPARARPKDCCAPPLPCEPLRARDRRRFVAAFRALGDPTRLEMFRLIASQPSPICVCDVVARFDLRQPTISHHLAKLRKAGLVTSQRRGVWTYFAPSAAGAALLRGAAEAVAGKACRGRC